MLRGLVVEGCFPAAGKTRGFQRLELAQNAARTGLTSSEIEGSGFQVQLRVLGFEGVRLGNFRAGGLMTRYSCMGQVAIEYILASKPVFRSNLSGSTET